MGQDPKWGRELFSAGSTPETVKKDFIVILLISYNQCMALNFNINIIIKLISDPLRHTICASLDKLNYMSGSAVHSQSCPQAWIGIYMKLGYLGSNIESRIK